MKDIVKTSFLHLLNYIFWYVFFIILLTFHSGSKFYILTCFIVSIIANYYSFVINNKTPIKKSSKIYWISPLIVSVFMGIQFLSIGNLGYVIPMLFCIFIPYAITVWLSTKYRIKELFIDEKAYNRDKAKMCTFISVSPHISICTLIFGADLGMNLSVCILGVAIVLTIYFLEMKKERYNSKSEIYECNRMMYSIFPVEILCIILLIGIGTKNIDTTFLTPFLLVLLVPSMLINLLLGIRKRKLNKKDNA